MGAWKLTSDERCRPHPRQLFFPRGHYGRSVGSKSRSVRRILSGALWRWSCGPLAVTTMARHTRPSPKSRVVWQPSATLACGLVAVGGWLSWLLQRERDGGAEKAEGLALCAGGLGVHRDDGAGAGEADLVAGQGGQVGEQPAEAAVGAAVRVVLAGGLGLGGLGPAGGCDGVRRGGRDPRNFGLTVAGLLPPWVSVLAHLVASVRDGVADRADRPRLRVSAGDRQAVNRRDD